MKKIYSKPLYKLFEQGLKQRWPEFKKDRKTDFGYNYCWEIKGVTRIFLELFVHPKGYAQFYCHFGWTSINQYLNEFLYEFPMLEPRKAFDLLETEDGIQRLWGNQGTGDFVIPTPIDSHNVKNYKDDPKAGMQEQWRLMQMEDAMTVEDGEKLVTPVVNELFEKLEKYVIPYLREYADYVVKKNITGF